jgi:hypothetical protein
MLTWTRERDGEHFGKPIYEYTAKSADRTYHIVWASDYGGTFGYTARDATEGYIHGGHSITWGGGRTLTRCKAACETIEERYNGKVNS